MKRLSLYVPVYALTLLLSAALLFSVQPMFSKMILPLLGGTPNVWNTAMLFFQLMLLGGYAYAHGTTHYLSIRAQAVVHLLLLCVFMIVLPLAIPDDWSPPTDKDPTLWQLSLMAITVGGPFFVLSASAPMLQRWFVATDHPDAHDPYFLYGASNLGSMTALLAYPLAAEPLFNLSAQNNLWAAGYAVLILLTGIAAALVWTQKKTKKPKTRAAGEDINWKRRLYWITLAFIPSSLMLGVATFITTDIASAPLFWVIPLALYVGTFIVAFARRKRLTTDQATMAQGLSILLLLALLILRNFEGGLYTMFLMIGVHIAAFFFSALACHMALVDNRPKAGHLTEFYMIMALGGALGGFFNAIIAPRVFVIPLEYALALAAACFMRHPEQTLSSAYKKLLLSVRKKKLDILFTPQAGVIFIVVFFSLAALTIPNTLLFKITSLAIAMACALYIKDRWLFAVLISFVLILFPPGYKWSNGYDSKIIGRERNFFGIIKVVDNRDKGLRVLQHGTTTHGLQRLDPERRLDLISYYSPASPLSDVFQLLDRRDGSQRIAVLGLGAGSVSCYRARGRSFDFFEIDPAIVKVAENPGLFTFLSDCKSPYNIILGDGRLTIKNQPDHSYDMILLDAFSSDNVPIHIMTLEAIEIYLKKLKKDGVLAFHVSNRFLDLEPVLAAAAENLKISAFGKSFEGTDNIPEYYPAHFVVLTNYPEKIRFFKRKGWDAARKREGIKAWSDQFSNIVDILGNKTGYERMKEQKR